MNRKDITVGETYIGEKGDLRRVVGIGSVYAPHKSTTDRVWVAYEMVSESNKNKGGQMGVSNDGFPIFHCSLTAFRVWAKEAADIKVVYAHSSNAIH